MKSLRNIFIKIVLSVAVLAALPSCELEEYNPSGSTADVVFSTPEGMDALVNQIYYNFRWKYFGREDPVLYLEGGTDLWYNAGKASYGPGMTQYSSALTPKLGQFANVWNRVYDNINLCNAVINRIEAVPYTNPAKKKYREGEARWMRSYSYWWLVEFFGDIELRLGETSTPNFYAYRTSAKKIYDEVIIPDAQKACEYLESKSIDGMVGRSTKKAAYGLLARVALTRASYASNDAEAKQFYQMALDAAKYVIDNKEALDIKLYNTYNEIWKAENNKTNTEYLAIVTHSSNSQYNPQPNNPNRLHAYFGPKLNGRVGIRTTEDSWEYPREATMLMPTKYFLKLFKEGDARYDIIFQEAFLANSEFTWTASSGDLALYLKSFDKIENPKVNIGDTALYFTRNQIPKEIKDKASYAVVDVDMLYTPEGKIATTNSQIYFSFPRFKKYRIYDPDSNVKLLVAANGVVGFADVPLMRYAEMPLIAAEAEIGLGNKANAANYINDLRKRIVKPGFEAEMTVSSSDMDLAFILEERARELCGEWLRWFDLKRTGKLVEYVSTHNPDIGSNVKDFHNLRPIPATFLDKLFNPEEFGQNPGY
jgi:hypothetical protein